MWEIEGAPTIGNGKDGPEHHGVEKKKNLARNWHGNWLASSSNTDQNLHLLYIKLQSKCQSLPLRRNVAFYTESDGNWQKNRIWIPSSHPKQAGICSSPITIWSLLLSVELVKEWFQEETWMEYFVTSLVKCLEKGTALSLYASTISPSPLQKLIVPFPQSALSKKTGVKIVLATSRKYFKNAKNS